MKIKNSIYILIDNSHFEVFYLDTHWVANNFFYPISTIVKSLPISMSNINATHDLLLAHKLPMGRYFYGITGFTTKENKQIRSYFKNKFKGANNMGSKSIKLRFSRLLLEYGERYLEEGYHPFYNKDPQIAFRFLEESMNWWLYPQTVLLVAYCYTFGIGTSRDISKAIALFEDVTKMDNSSLHRQNQHFSFYLDSVKAESFFFLGYIYKNGIGVIADNLKAKTFFMQGQALNNPRCINAMLEIEK